MIRYSQGNYNVPDNYYSSPNVYDQEGDKVGSYINDNVKAINDYRFVIAAVGDESEGRCVGTDSSTGSTGGGSTGGGSTGGGSTGGGSTGGGSTGGGSTGGGSTGGGGSTSTTTTTTEDVSCKQIIIYFLMMSLKTWIIF